MKIKKIFFVFFLAITAIVCFPPSISALVNDNTIFKIKLKHHRPQVADLSFYDAFLTDTGTEYVVTFANYQGIAIIEITDEKGGSIDCFSNSTEQPIFITPSEYGGLNLTVTITTDYAVYTAEI